MIELLYAALASPLGIIVETNNVTRLRNKLYEIKREDSMFEAISLSPSPTNPGAELWILNKGQPQ